MREHSLTDHGKREETEEHDPACSPSFANSGQPGLDAVSLNHDKFSIERLSLGTPLREPHSDTMKGGSIHVENLTRSG